MDWGKLFKTVAKGVVRGVSLGLIGRGRKTKVAAGLADEVLDEVLPNKDEVTVPRSFLVELLDDLSESNSDVEGKMTLHWEEDYVKRLSEYLGVEYHEPE